MHSAYLLSNKLNKMYKLLQTDKSFKYTLLRILLAISSGFIGC
ncbi:hypothetical protein DI53_1258 [Sphingobacterium deserti]|uniref:Uncharacterized protein n=1 Tax=Sphingobacterium deserti TaxID=1229276 RepID=A0A0B8T2C7_9SPHI|nr:hypothetical protein DI53_1258 [Sphingobacterium deserti]